MKKCKRWEMRAHYLVLRRDEDLPEGGEELQSSQQQLRLDALLGQQSIHTRQSLGNTITMNASVWEELIFLTGPLCFSSILTSKCCYHKMLKRKQGSNAVKDNTSVPVIMCTCKITCCSIFLTKTADMDRSNCRVRRSTWWLLTCGARGPCYFCLALECVRGRSSTHLVGTHSWPELLDRLHCARHTLFLRRRLTSNHRKEGQ